MASPGMQGAIKDAIHGRAMVAILARLTGGGCRSGPDIDTALALIGKPRKNGTDEFNGKFRMMV